MNTDIYMQTCEVLGSTAEFRIVTKDKERVEEVFRDLWAMVYDFEQQFSRFTFDSELTKSNAQAGEVVQISPAFREILLTAKQYGELTHGAFNPFILPSLERAGYTASMTTNLTTSPEYASRLVVPVSALQVGDTWARIPKDSALDLGGIGKGYCADLLAQKLSSFTSSFCLSLGGDMRVSGEEPNGPWNIDVESSRNRELSIGTYTHPSASSYGIATSGTERTKHGVTQAHLINARTGMPAETPYRTCTVVARNAAAADVLASCILIEGAELADRLYKEHHVEAILLQGDAGTEPLLWGEGFHLATPAGTHLKSPNLLYV